MPERFLTNHSQNVVGQDCQLQYKLIGVKLTGRKAFYIHIRLDLAVVLLTLTMFMVKPDHIVIRLTEVCPPGIYLDIGRKQIRYWPCLSMVRSMIS